MNDEHSDPTTGDAQARAQSFPDAAMECLELPEQMRKLLCTPQRIVEIELPLQHDDGSLHSYQGYRVQHKNARGPFKGGLRFHPQMTLDHARAPAEVMTWKTALVNIPFGGAKGGICCVPKKLSDSELERLTKLLTDQLIGLIGPNLDVSAPDIGTSARKMAWIYDAYARFHGHEPGMVTRKPLSLAGCPGRVSSTERGVALVTRWTAEAIGLAIADATVAIQGYGDVGANAARTLAGMGPKVVAVSDSQGGLYNPGGVDLEILSKSRNSAKPSAGISELDIPGDVISNEELLTRPVDILVPCALTNAIHNHNVEQINAKLVVEGANLPTSREAQHILEDNRVTVVPDILANAGGVIVSYLEWVQNCSRDQWTARRVTARMQRILLDAWQTVHERAQDDGVPYRLAAYVIAVERLANTMRQRGFF